MNNAKNVVPKNNLSAIVLAAGKGTRMGSNLPKVLHAVLGRPLLYYVSDTIAKIGIAETIVVLGPDTEPFAKFMQDYPSVKVCIQNQRRGTGDAVASAAPGYLDLLPPHYSDAELYKGSAIISEFCLICYGDVPLIPGEVLTEFIDQSMIHQADLSLIAIDLPDPSGYGRIIMKDGKFLKIVEDRDTDWSEKEVRLCNSGIVFGRVALIFNLLAKIKPNNSQGEYYLTDIFEEATRMGLEPFVYTSNNFEAFSGVNTPDQLANIEKWLSASI